MQSVSHCSTRGQGTASLTQLLPFDKFSLSRHLGGRMRSPHVWLPRWWSTRGTDIFAALESRPWVDLISHFSIVRKTECDPMAFEVNEHLATECEFSNHFLD